MKALSVTEAAKVLGLSPQRVRAMLKAGALPGEKVGRSWILDPSISTVRRSGPGRPLSAASAWGLLAILSRENPEWVDPAVRSRLKKRALDKVWVEQALLDSEPRSLIQRWRVLPSDLRRIEEDVHLVRSGLSARLPDLDVLGSAQELDVYADANSVKLLERRFQPDRNASNSNLTIRIPTHPWVLTQHPGAPPAVVAADLIDSDNARVARAARRLLRAND
jgi:excisionase family DNA binding protein